MHHKPLTKKSANKKRLLYWKRRRSIECDTFRPSVRRSSHRLVLLLDGSCEEAGEDDADELEEGDPAADAADRGNVVADQLLERVQAAPDIDDFRHLDERKDKANYMCSCGAPHHKVRYKFTSLQSREKVLVRGCEKFLPEVSSLIRCASLFGYFGSLFC